MKKCIDAAILLTILLAATSAAILLKLSLVAAAASVAGEVDSRTIRLPSDGKAGLTAEKQVVASDKETRPWTCCDALVRLHRWPPLYYCFDMVERCGDGCKKCTNDAYNPSLRACADPYDGYDPGPKCTAKERPWKCCNRPLCMRTYPPTCRCTDTVKQCDSACKSCEEDGYGGRYVCNDSYFGDPGPTCDAVAAGGN